MKEKVRESIRSHLKTIPIQIYGIVLILTIIIIITQSMDAVKTAEYNYDLKVQNRVQEHEIETQEFYQKKYRIIQKAVKIGYEAAVEQGSQIEEEVTADTRDYYGDNIDQLEEDLSSLHLDTPNHLASILKSVVEGKYILGMVGKDNMDPFLAILNYIITDLSFDCAPEDGGRTRTFEQEATGHFNATLARNTLNNISTYAQDRNIWIYVKVPENEPFYNDLLNLESIDEDILKELFFKYNGDVDIYKYPEFIYTNYIYSKEDLLGRPLIDVNGFRQDDSLIIMVNNGFNVYNILVETELILDLEYLDHEFELETLRKDQYIERQVNIRDMAISTEVYRSIILSVVMLLAVIVMAEYNNRNILKERKSTNKTHV